MLKLYTCYKCCFPFKADDRNLPPRCPACNCGPEWFLGEPYNPEEKRRIHVDPPEPEEGRFAAMHVFPYSVRPGTRAAAMPGQLTRAVKDARTHAAHSAAREMRLEYLAGCVGSVQSVLFETEEAGRCFGHAPNYAEVSVAGEGLRGLVKMVKITAISGEMLVGVAV